jgi:hypothetical protein
MRVLTGKISAYLVPQLMEAVNSVSGVDLLLSVAMDAQKGNIKPCYF